MTRDTWNNLLRCVFCLCPTAPGTLRSWVSSWPKLLWYLDSSHPKLTLGFDFLHCWRLALTCRPLCATGIEQRCWFYLLPGVCSSWRPSWSFQKRPKPAVPLAATGWRCRGPKPWRLIICHEYIHESHAGSPDFPWNIAFSFLDMNNQTNSLWERGWEQDVNQLNSMFRTMKHCGYPSSVIALVLLK